MQIRILASLALALFVACGASSEEMEPPLPPQLPRDFQWQGRYIVSDLDVDVPFSWQGKDGDIQMIAGGEEYKIYFTNLIYNDQLYTLTYKWPDVEPPPNPPKLPECSCVGQFTLDVLNACLAKSHYVGAEILAETEPRSVHHFRADVVLGPDVLKIPLRIPVMIGDFYVDRKDSSKFWKVLHFGYQNLFDPALDEWIVMDKFENTAGEVTLPALCRTVKCPATQLSAESCK